MLRVCVRVCGGCCFVVWRTLHVVGRLQILIGYEPKDSNYQHKLELIYRAKVELLFHLEIFVLCVRCVSDLKKGHALQTHSITHCSSNYIADQNKSQFHLEIFRKFELPSSSKKQFAVQK